MILGRTHHILLLSPISILLLSLTGLHVVKLLIHQINLSVVFIHIILNFTILPIDQITAFITCRNVILVQHIGTIRLSSHHLLNSPSILLEDSLILIGKVYFFFDDIFVLTVVIVLVIVIVVVIVIIVSLIVILTDDIFLPGRLVILIDFTDLIVIIIV